MKEPILILHGWGSLVSGEKRFGIVKSLLGKKGYVVYTPDLPGFGKNTLIKDQLFFDDYVSFVKEFLKEKKLKKVILIGHSFGGRIAIAFTALYPQYVSKLILAAASGIPHPLPSIKKKIVYYTTKIIKPLFTFPPFSWFYSVFRKLVYYSLGEMDYYKSGNLQKTFKNIYQVSVANDLPKILVPTLLIWGDKDTFVPVSDGKFMQQEIKGSRLVIEENKGHRFPYESPKKFVKDILEFIS